MNRRAWTLILLSPVVTVGLYIAISHWVASSSQRIDWADALRGYNPSNAYIRLLVGSPLPGSVFPPDMAPPTFRWDDTTGSAQAWCVAQEDNGRFNPISGLLKSSSWTPSKTVWRRVKEASSGSPITLHIIGLPEAGHEIVSAGTITFSLSPDPVGAPIFYREVNLPFSEAVKDPSTIRWRFGSVDSGRQPPVVLEGLPVCGNCHSFSADGQTLAMDVDYANSKGSYVIAPVAEEMTLATSDIITWNDYRREDGEQTFGLLSQVSPDGRHVVSTVKDKSVFVPRSDLAFSQLFFPIKGILAVYDRSKRAFATLPGADDPNFVQSNPSWSPDGKYIVFARAHAYDLDHVLDKKQALLTPEECREFLQDGKPFHFDLYRVPFNDGRGGTAEPIQGASGNGMSNFFAKYSPDGNWIVFCRAKNYMLLQPDSELYIIPADGGEARRLTCNTGRMNSWHSWSPNGRWLVFSSKANGPYTQLFLTHIDEHGQSTPPVVLDWFTSPDRAANIPEFVNAAPDAIARIREQFIDDT
ncbi:PD40 domain-containing protein, partial [bacterium]|nr:PD40 domain-containing protein [bacterium]